MGLLRNNKKTNKEPHQQDVAPITLSKTEAEVLLKAINQATFKGEYAKDVVSLILKFEEHISKFG
jgi:hypothetical protein